MLEKILDGAMPEYLIFANHTTWRPVVLLGLEYSMRPYCVLLAPAAFSLGLGEGGPLRG